MRRAFAWLGVALVATWAGVVSATDYHVDAQAGNDTTGDGSLAAPWQTLARASFVVLLPGDRLRLARGSVFRERLFVDESGTPADPIVVDAYGTGPEPVISAGSLIPQAGWTGPDVNGEFALDLGATVDFYSSLAVLVRADPTGIDTYKLLARGQAGSLAEDSYAALAQSGHRVLVYRPPSGALPGDFEFEISKRSNCHPRKRAAM